MRSTSTRVLEFLEVLQKITHMKLYREPSNTLAIFRRVLPALAKCFVMALLYLKEPWPTENFDLWVRSESRVEKDTAVSILERLHILEVKALDNGTKGYILNEQFAKSLRSALTGGEKEQTFGVPCKEVPEEEKVTVAQLDDYARRQWEGVLGYMVGTNVLGAQREGVSLSRGVKSLLQACHLVEVRDRRVEITKEGFAFVLQDINTQVWNILILYIENCGAYGLERDEIISLLFLLSCLDLGQSYEKKHLTTSQLTALDHLTDFGIVYQTPPVSQATHFYPTRLATTLTSDSLTFTNQTSGSLTAQQGTDESSSGFIIIETNYRLYAYTSSPLQISLIALFTTLKYRFPNLVTGKLTRQSIRRAVEMGITADQIISYLTTHAHPQMRRHQAAKAASRPGIPFSVIPPTVSDQIRLWQLERDRIKATPGFLFKDFSTPAEFEANCRYAEEIGVLVWKNEKTRMFFVTKIEPFRKK
ncbi:RNA polymerase II transcription factor B subunit 2 [Ascosphaera apis ARSEF 7405]|uniref:RNA polymerase II transcription factor B subunit 2 n=1 Tax=Ascosphaera apis ARSEF 7405 TaxID=392613 RepID=A0A166NC18_9EURO|nr:RNA polymerase II transcription factor B subunit 2 [Ascosphaera apis ARSEF 7405]